MNERPANRATLQYAAAPARSPLRITAVFLLAILLTPIHFALSMYVAACLGHNSKTGWGWTSLAWIPVGLFIGWVPLISAFMFLGSFAAALCLSVLILRLYFGIQPAIGRYYWRLWLVVCAWLLWFPVPPSLSVLH